MHIKHETVFVKIKNNKLISNFHSTDIVNEENQYFNENLSHNLNYK